MPPPTPAEDDLASRRLRAIGFSRLASRGWLLAAGTARKRTQGAKKKAAAGQSPCCDLFQEQTFGPIATGWSRWKKDASRTALRAAMVRDGPIRFVGPPDGILTESLIRQPQQAPDGGRLARLFCCKLLVRNPAGEGRHGRTPLLFVRGRSGTIHRNSTLRKRVFEKKRAKQTACRRERLAVPSARCGRLGKTPSPPAPGSAPPPAEHVSRRDAGPPTQSAAAALRAPTGPSGRPAGAEKLLETSPKTT